jgi:hypothetical protein
MWYLYLLKQTQTLRVHVTEHVKWLFASTRLYNDAQESLKTQFSRAGTSPFSSKRQQSTGHFSWDPPPPPICCCLYSAVRIVIRDSIFAFHPIQRGFAILYIYWNNWVSISERRRKRIWQNNIKVNKNNFRLWIGLNWFCDVRFEVFTTVTMKNGVFLDVTPCGSCKNWRFWGI